MPEARASLRMTRRVAAAIALVLAAATAHSQDATPTDDAARRSAIAKLGRLAWSDVGAPLAFCDLDGSNVVESDCRRADWIRWLADGSGVVANDGDHVRLVDATTGKSRDLTADAKPGERFVANQPLLSPDRRHVVLWRTAPPKSTWGDIRSGSLKQQVAGFALFDLAAGRRSDISPAPMPRNIGDAPIAAWTPDSSALFVALGTEPQRLTRFAPDGTRPQIVTTVSAGSRISQIAIQGERVLFAVQMGTRFDIRDTDGRTIFVRDGRYWCASLSWEPGGGALVVEAWPENFPAPIERWRVVAGESAKLLPSPWPPRREPSGDPAFLIETRQDAFSAPRAAYLAPASSGEPVALESAGPIVRVGGAFVFWRTTTPSSSIVRGTTHMSTPAVLDLWSYDPAARSFAPLTTRGFSPRCWDVFVAPEKPSRGGSGR